MRCSLLSANGVRELLAQDDFFPDWQPYEDRVGSVTVTGPVPTETLTFDASSDWISSSTSASLLSVYFLATFPPTTTVSPTVLKMRHAERTRLLNRSCQADVFADGERVLDFVDLIALVDVVPVTLPAPVDQRVRPGARSLVRAFRPGHRFHRRCRHRHRPGLARSKRRFGMGYSQLSSVRTNISPLKGPFSPAK